MEASDVQGYSDSFNTIGVGTVLYKPGPISARFYMEDRPEVLATEATKKRLEDIGEEIDPSDFSPKEFIEIKTDDHKTVIVREARDKDKKRFAHEYAAFKFGRPQLQGTPLEKWGEIKDGMRKVLLKSGILTVEQFAGATDDFLKAIGPGFVDLRVKAMEYSDNLEATAQARQILTKADKLAQTIEAQAKVINSLETRLAELENKGDPKNGGAATRKNAV